MKSPSRRIYKDFLCIIGLTLVVAIGAAIISNPSAADMQATKYEGYLADVLCATRGTALDGADMLRHPEKHSVACLKEPPCVASGFGILTKGTGDTFTFHKFDQKGNELALELIKKTQKKDSFSVEVTGQMKDGIINVTGIVEK